MRQISFIVVIVYLLVFFSCTRNDEFPVGKKVVCDAEQLDLRNEKFVSPTDSISLFDGGNQQTNLTSFNGNYAVLTYPGKAPYAFGYKIKRAGPDWYFKVSVWRKSKDGKGALVAASKDAITVYQAISEPVEFTDDGWEKLEAEILTPPNFGYNELNFYVWNNGSDTVYYDDFRIERFESKFYPEYDEDPLSIYLDTSDYIKIVEKRKQAFKDGILQTTDNDWVKAIVFNDDRVLKARLRLKGDWLDHLRGNKWSFRIKMRRDYAWKRLRTFSIQTPESRNFLMEWEAHQLFLENDILTTRYGFIPFIFNGQNRGLYAWEEHFDKQLLEWRKRREGPILKFTEDAFWEMQKINIKTKGWILLPFFEASVIKPFKQNRIVSDSVLYLQYLNGQKLMLQYKNHSHAPAEIFDIRKMAAYFALYDLTKMHHGFAWHNQRFYFNPVICKLEPIVFDCYGEHPEFKPGNETNIAFRAFSDNKKVQPEDYLVYDLFKDSLFTELYIHYLEKYTSQEFITEFTQSIQPARSFYDSLIRREFPYYKYDPDFISQNAVEIRDFLPDLKSFIKQKQASGVEQKIHKTIYNDTSVYNSQPNVFVIAYLEKKIRDSVVIQVQNYLTRDLLLLGTGSGSKYVDYFLIEEPRMSSFAGEKASLLSIVADTGSRYLFFMVKDRFETYSIPILPWPYPSGLTSQQELMQTVDLNRKELFVKKNNNELHFHKKVHQVERPLIIPPGYAVFVDEGTTLNFVNRSMFISYSPVFIRGSKDKPVTITSSDFSMQGFTVLQANRKSIINHALFSKMNTLDYKGWTLTGAVNFYESDVSISNTVFYRNKCEDALNTIRSEFVVENSKFEYIYGDAFDADFCEGIVANTYFSNVKNDAIDFSGSRIKVVDSRIENTEDKGISGGEESTLQVENTIIKNTNIGIASKDLSDVEVRNSLIQDCNYGLVLLQKKVEYGPASIVLLNTPIINPQKDMLIERGSEVEADGKRFSGTEEKLVDIFYK